MGVIRVLTDRGTVEERHDASPVAAPGLTYWFILFISFILELREPRLSFVGGEGVVDQLQIGGHSLLRFPGHEVQAVAHHVDNAELNSGLRVDRLDGVRKAIQAARLGELRWITCAAPSYLAEQEVPNVLEADCYPWPHPDRATREEPSIKPFLVIFYNLRIIQ